MGLRNFFKNKTVLVTGHTGFKGAWLSIWLNEMGANVIGYALDPYYKNSVFELSKLAGKITDIRGDIRDIGKLKKVFKAHRPQIVVHLAAQSLLRLSYDIPRATFETNVMGTINIIECLKEYRPKSIVLVTSDKCYKNVEQKKGYTETDLLSDRDPYSCSKGCAEMAVQSYRNSFGLKMATARAGNVIGGGDWAPDRLVPDIIRSLKKGARIKIRNPRAVRPWQFVLEPLSGYLILAKEQYEGKDLSGGWNFGPDRTSIVSVKSLAEMIVDEWGGGEMLVQKDSSNKHEAQLLYLDCSRSKSKLKWKPLMNMKKTVKYIVEWYKNYGAGDTYKLCAEQIKRYEGLMRKAGRHT